MRQTDDLGLTLDARCGVADLQRAVVVDGRARITARIASPSASASSSGFRTTIPTPSPPTVPCAARRTRGNGRRARRCRPPGTGSRLCLVRVDRHPAGKGDVALAIQEALARVVDGHERRRARRLDVHARSAQIELVARRASAGSLPLSTSASAAPGGRDPFRVRQQVESVCYWLARRRTRRYGPRNATDRRRRPRARATHIPGTAAAEDRAARLLAGRIAKERRVKAIDIIELSTSSDVIGIAQHRIWNAGFGELGLREEPDRLDAVAQVVPERLQIRRSREAAGHADDRDRA